MAIAWNNVFDTPADVQNYVYRVLVALEDPILRPNIPAAGSGITIGIGYDLKAGTDEVRAEVLRTMGLQVQLLTLNGPLSESQQIELSYVNRMMVAIKGSSLTAVDQIMLDRANDAALTTAMTAEQISYERRNSFRFSGQDEVRAVYDSVAYDLYRTEVERLVGSAVAGDANFATSLEKASLIVMDWLAAALVPWREIRSGNRAAAWVKIRYGWKESDAPKRIQTMDGWHVTILNPSYSDFMMITDPYLVSRQSMSIRH